MTFQKENLPNRLRLIKVPMQGVNSVTLLVMFKVGSRYEKTSLAGAAHYIEHLMFKGTEHRRDTLAITKELDSVGADYNAFTSKDYTGYYVHVSKEYLRLAFDIVSDMLFHSKFDAKEMEREKKVIVEEIKMYKENPMMHLEELFETLMYKGSTLGREIGGTPQSVLQMDRAEVLDFKEKFYQTHNALVCIAGNIDEKVDEYISEFFHKEFHDKKVSIPGFKKFATSGGYAEVFDTREVEQAQLGLGFLGYSYDDKRLSALKVLAIILGGNMSSRLFISVREKRGLCYFISASTNVFEDTGNFFIHAGLDAKRTREAIKVIVSELDKIKKYGVSKEELQRAKNFLRGKVTLSLEDTEDIAQWYAKQELLVGKMRTPHEFLDEIDKVTATDVMKVAKDVFRKNKARLAIIGPIPQKESFASLIKL